AFESFGVYFAIIIGVANQILYFLVILCQPTINDDPNNLWNLNTTYNQIENGTIAQGASFVQAPDENTNLFTDYKTALFAMYLFLTAIEKENNRVSYLIQKAEILAEIELFYLLPLYYYADIDKTQRRVKELINEDEWKTEEFPEMKQNLLKILNINETVNFQN
ncbi:hypothetical protein C1645_842583, partial [Glomus cerebriforme]